MQLNVSNPKGQHNTHQISISKRLCTKLFFSQAAWRTGAVILGGVLEGVFGAEVYREGASELGLYCDHLLENR